MAAMFTPGALGALQGQQPDPTEDDALDPTTLQSVMGQMAVLRNNELESRKKSWDMVAQRLEKSRPSKAEMWFSLASALGQPTKTGSFGETLGNTAEALGKSAAERRDYESKVADTMLQRDQDLAELGSKYDLKGIEMQIAANKAGNPKFMQVANGYLKIVPGQAPEYIPLEGIPDVWKEETRNNRRGQVSTSGSNKGEWKPYTGEASGELPAPLEKRKMDTLEEIGLNGSISSDTRSLADDIENGRLNLSLFGNLLSGGINAAGIGTEESAKYATFRSTLERLRGDTLRLNNGVQTKSDADNAWNELFGNISSEKAVIANLKKIDAINQRAAAIKGRTLNEMLTSRGQEAINLSDYGIQPATVGTAANPPSANVGQRRSAPTAPPTKGAAPKAAGPVRITSDAEYDKLKPKTVFIDPEGRTRTKP